MLRLEVSRTLTESSLSVCKSFSHLGTWYALPGNTNIYPQLIFYPRSCHKTVISSTDPFCFLYYFVASHLLLVCAGENDLSNVYS